MLSSLRVINFGCPDKSIEDDINKNIKRQYSAEKAATLRRHCEARSNPIATKHSARKSRNKVSVIGSLAKQSPGKLSLILEEDCFVPRNDEEVETAFGYEKIKINKV